MSGRLDFEFGFNSNNAQPIGASKPMRMYFLGDFSGNCSQESNSSGNKILKIDIDNFDQVMAKLCPTITLPSGQQLSFSELEDFHPDSLFEERIFSHLRRLKKELSNSTTAEKAAQEIISTFQIGAESQPTDDIDSDKASGLENNDDMFERLLGQKQSAPTPSSTPQTKGNIDNFLASILSPHIIKDAKPEHQSLLVFIDTAIEELMRSIIHGEEFQGLEALWRSVRDVIFNEEYDDEEQLFYIINSNSESLKNAVSGDPDLLAKLSQHIKDCDIDTYDVIISDHQFADSSDDVTTLNYLASVAESLNCQLVAGATDSLVNADEASLWQQFRKTPQSRHVALTYPRMLLRIPYGEKHEEVDVFRFEEFQHQHQHSQLLWGSSAFACARLLIRQYHGNVPFDSHITELPAFVYEQDDEQKLHPCGEYLLSEKQLTSIQTQGINPFVSFRSKNCVRIFGDKIKVVHEM